MVASKYQFSRRITLLLILAYLILPRQHLLAAEFFELQPYLRTITLTGFTYPRQEITVTSEVSGRCLEIFGDIGDPVPENEELVKIDTTFIQLEIEANRIAQQQTRRQLEQEEKSLMRYTTLLSQKSTPQARLDEVNLAADLNRLTLQKLKNDAARLHEKLARHTLTAPKGWQIIERYTEPGEFIQAGRPVVRLGDFQSLLVPLAMTYSELQAISRQQQLSLYLPDIDKHVTATVYRSSPIFDAATRKIQIDLIINTSQLEKPKTLRGGMRVDLQFESPETTRSFVVPKSALISRYEATWLVQPDDLRIQVIYLGTTDNGESAIVSGESLLPGQTYQTSPKLSR